MRKEDKAFFFKYIQHHKMGQKGSKEKEKIKVRKNVGKMKADWSSKINSSLTELSTRFVSLFSFLKEKKNTLVKRSMCLSAHKWGNKTNHFFVEV